MSELSDRSAARPVFETDAPEPGEQSLGFIPQLAHPRVTRLPFAAQLPDHQLAVADNLKIEGFGEKLAPLSLCQRPAKPGQERPVLRFVVGPAIEFQAIEHLDPGGSSLPYDPI